MFSFRYTSSVCKHKKQSTIVQNEPKHKAPNSCSYRHQILTDFTDSVTVRPSKQLAIDL